MNFLKISKVKQLDKSGKGVFIESDQDNLFIMGNVFAIKAPVTHKMSILASLGVAGCGYDSFVIQHNGEVLETQRSAKSVFDSCSKDANYDNAAINTGVVLSGIAGNGNRDALVFSADDQLLAYDIAFVKLFESFGLNRSSVSNKSLFLTDEHEDTVAIILPIRADTEKTRELFAKKFAL